MSSKLALLGGDPVRTAPFPTWPVFDRAEEEAVLAVVRSGRWGQAGEDVTEAFERRFAEYHHARHGILVTSGTTALKLSLLAAGLGSGDEVIVPAYTFMATATAVVDANATPVFVDVDPRTYTLSPAAVEAAITPRTRVIMPVHFAGCPAEMDPLCRLAERYGLALIEDAAQAHGAEYGGRRVGSIGVAGCFSFQSSKNLNAGEGGMIVTSDDRLAARARAIRNCARFDDPALEEPIVNGNSRVTAFQSALLNAQMDRLDSQMETREATAARLRERLADVPGIEPQERRDYVTRHAYHLFSFRYDPDVYGVPRKVFLAALEAEGIPATDGYTLPVYRQPLFASQSFGPYSGARLCAAPCPVAERACAAEGAWLYQRLLLGGPEDADAIGDAFAKIHENREELALPQDRL